MYNLTTETAKLIYNIRECVEGFRADFYAWLAESEGIPITDQRNMLRIVNSARKMIGRNEEFWIDLSLDLVPLKMEEDDDD